MIYIKKYWAKIESAERLCVSIQSQMPNISRYGRCRKPSELAKVIVCAYYREEDYVVGYKAYTHMSNFMYENFNQMFGPENKYCYAFEEQCSGQSHINWSLTGNNTP